jgi:hypothetical protein
VDRRGVRRQEAEAMSYDVSNRSQEWLQGFLEGQRITLAELEDNTAKIDGRFVQLERYDGAPWEMTDAGPRQLVLYREAPDA